MDARTQSAFEQIRIEQLGESVEIFAELRAGLFGVEQSDMDTVCDLFCEQLKERNKTPRTTNVHVLDISRHDPKKILSLWHNFLDHPPVDILIK